MPILNEVIDWVKNKPSFWQVAIDKLIRNNTLSDDDIYELTELCKMDSGLSTISFTKVDFDDLISFVSSAGSNDNIAITKIQNIENISALSNANVLEFAIQGLTVVYGDNGSGKSSYVSILKHVCNTRGSKPKINGNLYTPATFNNDKKAEVEFTNDGINLESVSLLNEKIDKLSLKSVDVFDTSSADHYIEYEDEIAFIPHGLAILEKFAVAIGKIEANLNTELNQLSAVAFDYLRMLEVPETSKAKSFLTNLNANTTRGELRSESEWSKKKEARIAELIRILSSIKASDPKIEIKSNEDRIRRFRILRSKFKALEDELSGNAVNEIQSTINAYVISKQALKDASEKAFEKLPLVGVGNHSWQILWESARTFYNESTEKDAFPDENGSCPLCLQELSPEAKSRFSNFEEFVKNDIQIKFADASQNIELLISRFNALSTDFKEQEPIIAEINEFYADIKLKNESYIASLHRQKLYLTGLINAKLFIEEIFDLECENFSSASIDDLINELESANENLKSKTVDKLLGPLEQEYSELLGEKKLYDHRPKLGREICRQKKVDLLQSCISRCNTRTITILSNELTTSYVSQNLKDNFRSELRKLGFNYVKIETETKGSKGKQYHYLKLDEPNSSDVSLKDVLSEGEHRCISLATFLSELSISDHHSTIIFDDPVSSLDHKWRDRIGGRIAEESVGRQVIVFTHDITFLLMLQEHSKRLGINLEIKSLTRKKKETGIIASNPPWDALPVSKRVGLLKNAYQALEKVERLETEEKYKERAKMLYGKLREAWERFTEEILLNGAIQRFGREIQTQRIKAIIDLSDSDYSVLDANMSKCSRYFWGHDSSGELIDNMPDSAEFLADILVLDSFINTIRNRRNKK